ncbi:hypothetical protein H4O14_02240 [Bacillus sp. PAMC26568]|nr:hypothetical protein H4O14_02240 [Bacillus sp. PAMC26568]
MTIIIVILIAIVLFAFNEWAKYEIEKERLARVAYVNQKQNSKVGLCSECYYHRKLNYSKVENLWLCDKCE